MVYFISDVHLGSKVMANPEEHQARFVNLLKKIQQDATAIYLLGDIFDFWVEYYWPNGKHVRQFEPTLQALREAVSHCPVHFFRGNHDMWTFGWLAQITGVQVHNGPALMTINGKRCFLAHGDGLGSRNLTFLRLREGFKNPILRVLFSSLPPSWGDAFGYAWAASSRQKEIKNPIGFLGEKDEELLRFARAYDTDTLYETMDDADDADDYTLVANPQKRKSRKGGKLSRPERRILAEVPKKEPGEKVDYYVFGHRHIELTFMLPSRACVYILGDFFKQYTYAQMDDAGNMMMVYDEEE